MNTLPLAPLPSETSEESNQFRRIDSAGFIDEQVVSRVIAGGAYERTSLPPSEMVLCASGDDYAGWMLPVKSPFREMINEDLIAAAAPRLPEAPRQHQEADPGIDTPYLGGHRWWLFGISGAMACGIMALTIFSLSPRHDMVGLATTPASAANQREVPAAAEKTPAFPPALTTALPAER